MSRISIYLITALLFPCLAAAQKSSLTLINCPVLEPAADGGTRKVTVQFAVKNLGEWNAKATLEPVPGLSSDDGLIQVSPKKDRHGKYSLMTNLNGQGGDLRIEGSNIRLFGDGDGYQFTDLVLWNVDDLEDPQGIVLGYVHDYGSTYAKKTETFKQFIRCRYQRKL